jgi:hypothetical protein
VVGSSGHDPASGSIDRAGAGELTTAEPPPVAAFGIVAVVLIGTLLVGVGELATATQPSLELIFGGVVVVVLVGIAWLVSALEDWRRYVHEVQSSALDVAAIAQVQGRNQESQRVLEELSRAEEKLSRVGAYAAASVVGEARRRLA